MLGQLGPILKTFEHAARNHVANRRLRSADRQAARGFLSSEQHKKKLVAAQKMVRPMRHPKDWESSRYHEVGHAVLGVALKQPFRFSYLTVSIESIPFLEVVGNPQVRGNIPMNFKLEKNDTYEDSKRELLNVMAFYYGGMAAEHMIGTDACGADSDDKIARKIARQFVQQFALQNGDMPSRARVDREVNSLVREAQELATQTLHANWSSVEELANRTAHQPIFLYEEIEKIVRKHQNMLQTQPSEIEVHNT